MIFVGYHYVARFGKEYNETYGNELRNNKFPTDQEHLELLTKAISDRVKMSQGYDAISLTIISISEAK